MNQRILKNARVYTEGQWQSRDIGINNGTLCPASALSSDASIEDLAGQKLMPAAIDGWCHLPLHGDLDQNILSHGIGECVVSPASKRAEPTEQSSVKLHRLAYLSASDQTYHLADIKSLADRGFIGFTQGQRALPDTKSLLSALNYAAGFDLLVVLRPADASLSQDALMHYGRYSMAMGLTGEPACSEAIATGTLIALAKASGCRIHLSRVTTAEAVAMIGAAKDAGMAISADTALANLRHTDAELYGFNTHFKTWPVIRDQQHQDALREGLKLGVIDFVVSNHRPVRYTEKSQTFEAASWGMASQPSFLAELWQLCESLGLSDARRLELLRGGVERIYRLPAAPNDLSSGAAQLLCENDHGLARWTAAQ